MLRIHELIGECQKRGIVLDAKIKYKSQDYLKLLGEYSLIQKYKSLDRVPFPILYRFNLQSPMLSKSFKNISIERKQEILNNKDGRWVAEYNYTGCRVILIYYPDSGLHVFSREVSLEDFLPIDYTDKILFLKNGKLNKPLTYVNKFPKPFVLDCKIILPDYVDTSLFYTKQEGQRYDSLKTDAVSSLLSLDIDVCHELQITEFPFHFVIFDALFYDIDIRERHFHQQRVVLDQLVPNLIKYELPFQSSVSFNADFMSVFNDYLQDGGDGLIFKNLDKPYFSTTGRKADVQVKLKPNMLSSLKEIFLSVAV